MAVHIDVGNLLIAVVLCFILGYYIYMFYRDSRVVKQESFDLITKNIDENAMTTNGNSKQLYADYHQDQGELQNNKLVIDNNANSDTNKDVDKIKALDDRVTKIESRLNTTETTVNAINTKINNMTPSVNDANNSKPTDNKTNNSTQNVVNTSGVYGLLDDPISAIANYELTNCIKDTAGKCVVLSPYLI